MRFRIKAFAIHIAASAAVLALILGGLYLGWYRWPGWYVTNAVRVSGILIAMDVTLGPLFTLLVASPRKAPRVLARDIAVIVTVQLVALTYGAATLWGGRPLYYAYSSTELETVAASQVSKEEVELARKLNPDLAPHWYDRPRWVWAPLPSVATGRDRIAGDSKGRQGDVTQMPRYFKPLPEAGDTLRAQLRRVDDILIFTRKEKQVLKERMAQRGLATDEPDALFMIGRDRPVLAVFDRTTLDIKALIRAN
jgi:hypothetical protein